MVNSRAKGARGELEARDAVRQAWHAPACIRAAQAHGKHSADLLHALPGFHVEVKSYAKIRALRFLAQAAQDMNPDDVPVVLMREKGDTRWAVMFWIQDTEDFVHAYECNRVEQALPT